MNILIPSEAIEARETLNLSQALVARETGMNRSYLSQFESGRRILEDRWQRKLRDHYVSMGWEQNRRQADSESPVGPAPCPGITIRDGFVIAETAAEDDLDGLLDEYHECTRLTDELGQAKLKRGFFDDLDEEGALAQAKQYFVLTARLHAIVRELHGQLESGQRENHRPAEFSKVATVGEYVNYLIATTATGTPSV